MSAISDYCQYYVNYTADREELQRQLDKQARLYELARKEARAIIDRETFLIQEMNLKINKFAQEQSKSNSNVININFKR